MFSYSYSEKPESRDDQLPKTKPLPSIETLGPPPPKPSKPPFVNLQAFHKQPTAVSKTLKEGKKMHRTCPHQPESWSGAWTTCLSLSTLFPRNKLLCQGAEHHYPCLLAQLGQLAHGMTRVGIGPLSLLSQSASP